ncbi:non-ribosomal peptide synthetase [Nonomuraea rubra]
MAVGPWADLVADVDGADLQLSIAESDVCCVLYTSGSTGQPKGVMITHANLVAFARAAANAFGLDEADRFLQVAPSTFDVQFEELFPVWCAGGAVVLDAVSLRDTPPAQLLRRLAQRHVSAVELPTAYWKELSSVIGRTDVAVPESLRLVLLGGERVSAAYAERWSTTGVELYNVYGLTECAVTSLRHRCGAGAADDDIPIGTALTHADVWLVDPDGNVCTAPGSVGEILIGGPGLAVGYLNDPRRTAGAFVPDSYSGRSGARVYRTGDLGLLLDDGAIAFVGRRDEQLSVRGHRVEPGEIEAAIEAHPAVGQAAVVLSDDEGPTRLTAFVTGPASGQEDDIAAFVEQRLPTYMVPARFVPVDELPMTPHGKVDRPALLRMAKEHSEPGAGPASRLVGDVEHKIAALWSDILGGGPFDHNDGFFELGVRGHGDSLTAIAMVTRLQQEFGVAIPIRQLYSRHTTIRRLGTLVSRHQGGPRV